MRIVCTRCEITWQGYTCGIENDGTEDHEIHLCHTYDGMGLRNWRYYALLLLCSALVFVHGASLAFFFLLIVLYIKLGLVLVVC